MKKYTVHDVYKLLKKGAINQSQRRARKRWRVDTYERCECDMLLFRVRHSKHLEPSSYIK